MPRMEGRNQPALGLWSSGTYRTEERNGERRSREGKRSSPLGCVARGARGYGSSLPKPRANPGRELGRRPSRLRRWRRKWPMGSERNGDWTGPARPSLATNTGRSPEH